MPAATRAITSTVTRQEQINQRAVLRAGASPFQQDRPLSPRVDTSTAISCPQCRRRFVAIGDRSAEANLAAHVEVRHGPKPGPAKGTAKTEQGAEMLQRVISTITDRIKSGELRPGQVLLQNPLADDLQVTRRFVALGVEQLVRDGLLAYGGQPQARRVVVVRTP